MMAARKQTVKAISHTADEEQWLWEQAAKLAYSLQCVTVPSAPSSIRQRFYGRGVLESELLRRMAVLVGVTAAD
ncbi:MAG: hypothetical protein ACM359_00960 [Bacillota bacterium]